MEGNIQSFKIVAAMFFMLANYLNIYGNMRLENSWPTSSEGQRLLCKQIFFTGLKFDFGGREFLVHNLFACMRGIDSLKNLCLKWRLQ